MQQRCSAAWMPGRKRAIPSKVRATSQQPRSLRAKSEEQSAKQLKLVPGKGQRQRRLALCSLPLALCAYICG